MSLTSYTKCDHCGRNLSEERGYISSFETGRIHMEGTLTIKSKHENLDHPDTFLDSGAGGLDFCNEYCLQRYIKEEAQKANSRVIEQEAKATYGNNGDGEVAAFAQVGIEEKIQENFEYTEDAQKIQEEVANA